MPSPCYDHPCRVILLLDLDCFYAQCERVRLGLENATTSLALLQWNSVLAVTYPARELFDIKRGDSWDQVQAKSNGQCLAIHLPLLTELKAEGRAASTDDTVEAAYEQVFQLSHEERQRVLTREVGRRRQNSEGKACLERYRLASTRIFGVVLQALEERLSQQFILERASIDELFIDVTDYCWEDSYSRTVEESEKIRHIMRQTCLVAHDNNCSQDDDPRVVQALHRGAWVASEIRAAVFDQLGFTISAGISTSKLTAKLGASYGKPNGQALIVPSRIPAVMAATMISKCRNLGGKIGKIVCRMLPGGEKETMGSVSQHLSLPMLVQELGPSSAQLVFDAARGMDSEPVKSTQNALVKSITSFKSFPRARVDGIDPWLRLLAADIVRRVETDSHRNHRLPKSCTVHYNYSQETITRTSRSLRIVFPRDNNASRRIDSLVQRTKSEIVSKEGENIWLYRVGLCAMNFEMQSFVGGISSFFKTTHSPDGKASVMTARSIPITGSLGSPELSNSSSNADGDEQLALKLQKQYDCDKQGESVKMAPRTGPEEPVDRDLELARKLQQQYDREHNVLAILDQRPKKRKKIDSFFTQFRTK